MNKSQRIRLRDVRNLWRLIGECRDLAHDSLAWRRHMFEQLCNLVGARVGVGGEAVNLWSPSPQIVASVDVGWEDETERGAWLEYLRNEELASDPIFRSLRKLTRPLRTRTRRQLIEDRVWYRSRSFNEYRRVSRVDACINSFYDLQHEPGITHGITLHRSLNEPPFGLREIRLVHYFHRELGPLIGRQLASAREPSVSELPLRLQQTVQCLVEGDSEKQAALRLGVSPQTIHEYTKLAYRRLGVRSRGELFSRWVRSVRQADGSRADASDNPGKS